MTRFVIPGGPEGCDPTPDVESSPLDTLVDAAYADDFDPPPPASW